jgi:hypothetical protein
VSTQFPGLPEGRLPSEAPLVDRPVEAVAELRIRHSELKSISERLDHVAALSRAKKWELRSQVTFGALGGGFIGLVPFLAVGPPLIASAAYVAVLVVALILSLTYSGAADDVSAERADSILAIKEHIDNTMLRTDTPRLQAPTRRLGPGPQPADPPVDPSPRPVRPGED